MGEQNMRGDKFNKTNCVDVSKRTISSHKRCTPRILYVPLSLELEELLDNTPGGKSFRRRSTSTSTRSPPS